MRVSSPFTFTWVLRIELRLSGTHSKRLPLTNLSGLNQSFKSPVSLSSKDVHGELQGQKHCRGRVLTAVQYYSWAFVEATRRTLE